MAKKPMDSAGLGPAITASVKALVVAARVTSKSAAKKYVVFRDDDIGF
jgi:hypothetical protein